MPDTSDQWTALDSENERLVRPASPATPVTPETPEAEVPQAASPDSPRRGWHGQRAVAAAAAATALAMAGAAAVPASAAGAAGGHGQLAVAKSAATARSWQRALSVHSPSDSAFTAVTATGRRRAWAFQSPGDASVAPAAWRLAGSRWSRVSFPGRAGQTVAAAGASSARNVWAFTQDGARSRAFRWNGTSWQGAGSFSRDVGATVVLSHRNVWAFGAPDSARSGLGARHYNGSTWRRVPSGHGLNSGSALSARSIWAVGGKQVAHWNGHVWSRTSVAAIIPPNTQFCHPTVTGIYARSANSVWAVGLGNCEDEIGPGFLLHYNGQHWRRVARSSSFGAPVAVAPDGRSGLWIPSFTGSGGPVHMTHYSGGRVQNVPMPVGARRLRLLGIATVRQTTTSFAVGATFKRSMPGVDQKALVFEFRR
jgi:hypothetical protein